MAKHTARRLACVIDDDAAVRDSICTLLATYDLATISFERVEDFFEAGATALACLFIEASRRPAMTMEFIARLRDIAGAVPIIVMTSDGLAPHLAVIAAAPGVTVIEKPFLSHDLEAALSQALRHG
jgi:FixJ family two-component response regulator